MKKSFCIALVIAAAGCASTKRNDDAVDMVPPAQTLAAQQSADLTSKIDALQTSLTELLERLDVMNDRIAKLEAAPAQTPAPARETSQSAGVPPSPAPVPAPLPSPHVMPPNPLAGVQLANTYRGALVLFGRGKFDDARRTFQQVFDQDPTGDLADNCLFWIGETYYATGKFGEAMKYYKRVTVEFGDQNKAPDAMFKIALAFEKTSDLGMAKQTLDEVIRRYPYSSAAASAKLELKRIRY
jgi:tol-pal system protein YbgF